eukprot:TRINITY_DN4017_c0_g4_i1.p1 TRINITY_DN4017_c0_g4~~TRINITY_DN4017_c0_g4_i1.p1  ORF type:complete len:358 (-),score=89.23 TRINITY_DN4017_c0_g4_i1:89-1162(-)
MEQANCPSFALLATIRQQAAQEIRLHMQKCLMKSMQEVQEHMMTVIEDALLKAAVGQGEKRQPPDSTATPFSVKDSFLSCTSGSDAVLGDERERRRSSSKGRTRSAKPPCRTWADDEFAARCVTASVSASASSVGASSSACATSATASASQPFGPGAGGISAAVGKSAPLAVPPVQQARPSAIARSPAWSTQQAAENADASVKAHILRLRDNALVAGLSSSGVSKARSSSSFAAAEPVEPAAAAAAAAGAGGSSCEGPSSCLDLAQEDAVGSPSSPAEGESGAEGPVPPRLAFGSEREESRIIDVSEEEQEDLQDTMQPTASGSFLEGCDPGQSFGSVHSDGKYYPSRVRTRLYKTK